MASKTSTKKKKPGSRRPQSSKTTKSTGEKSDQAPEISETREQLQLREVGRQIMSDRSDQYERHGYRLWRRLKDRTKPPRRWWFPGAPSQNLNHKEAWQRRHDEISQTIRRVMLTLIAFSFFCLLSLAAPDASLLSSGAVTKVPFADVQVSYIAFLIVGPLVLIGLTIYLQIFLEEWWLLGVSDRSDVAPFLFNLDNPIAKLLSGFLFYWLSPVVLMIFAWKALPRAEAPWLLCITAALTGSLVWLQIRRCPQSSRRARNPILWVLVVVLATAVTNTAWRMAVAKPPLLSRPLNLFKAQLHGQDLRAANLTLAFMREADLRQADLRSAKLIEADLSGADLNRATLGTPQITVTLESGTAFIDSSWVMSLPIPANLARANLTEATLKSADLSGVNLSGATLTRTDLSEANLVRARLNNARFLAPRLEGADLNAADLRGIAGLSCTQLSVTKNWERAYRDEALACGASVPRPPASLGEPSSPFIIQTPVVNIAVKG